jgi:hypothetical protein
MANAAKIKNRLAVHAMPDTADSTNSNSISKRKNICSSQTTRVDGTSAKPMSKPHSTEAISLLAIEFRNQSTARQSRRTIEAKNIVTVSCEKYGSAPSRNLLLFLCGLCLLATAPCGQKAVNRYFARRSSRFGFG